MSSPHARHKKVADYVIEQLSIVSEITESFASVSGFINSYGVYFKQINSVAYLYRHDWLPDPTKPMFEVFDGEVVWSTTQLDNPASDVEMLRVRTTYCNMPVIVDAIILPNNAPKVVGTPHYSVIRVGRTGWFNHGVVLSPP